MYDFSMPLPQSVDNQFAVNRRFGHTKANPAFGYGGGVDFRLSKLMSLRGEIRQFALFGTVPGSRFAISPSLGLAVHF